MKVKSRGWPFLTSSVFWRTLFIPRDNQSASFPPSNHPCFQISRVSRTKLLAVVFTLLKNVWWNNTWPYWSKLNTLDGLKLTQNGHIVESISKGWNLFCTCHRRQVLAPGGNCRVSKITFQRVRSRLLCGKVSSDNFCFDLVLYQ